jgi:hypothetical protein
MTKLYDRTSDAMTLDEVELPTRIQSATRYFR